MASHALLRDGERGRDFRLLLEGGSLTEDLELGVVLPAHYGEQEAERLIGEWVETFAP
jgi:hypothetical protein